MKRNYKRTNRIYENIVAVAALILIVGLVYLAFTWSHLYDKKVFKTIPEGEITLVESGRTVFIPKGAYVLGEAHLYSSNDDVVFDNTLEEGQLLKAEQLVKTYGQVVVYWSLDQEAAAESMLDS